MFKSTYESAVYKATSSTLPEPDLVASLYVVDLINPKTKDKRSEPEVKSPAEILAPIKKRFEDKRPQVKYLTLELVDILVKNCGDIGFNAIFATNFVAEIAESVNGLSQFKDRAHVNKVAELINLWNESFKNIDHTVPNRPSWLASLRTAHSYLANNGYHFPEVKKEDLISHRYHTPLVINDQTRALYEGQKDINNLTDEQIIQLIEKNEQEEQDKKKREMEDRKLQQQEEAELAKALELSKIEAGGRAPEAGPGPSSGYPNLDALNVDESGPSQNQQNEQGPNFQNEFNNAETHEVPENGKTQMQPSSAATFDTIEMPLGEYHHDDENLMVNLVQNQQEHKSKIEIYGSDSSEYLTEEDESFLKNFNKSIDMLNLRMKSITQRNRSIYSDPTSQQLIASIMSKHSKLHEVMANIDGQRQHYEQFQTTLTEMSHARTAIDEMRLEKLRQEELIKQQEAERKRAEMQAKLDYLRQNKERVLEQKRQHALMTFSNYRQMMGPVGAVHQIGATAMGYVGQPGPAPVGANMAQFGQMPGHQISYGMNQQNLIGGQNAPQQPYSAQSFQTNLPQNTPYPANAPTPSQFSTFSGEDNYNSIKINPTTVQNFQNQMNSNQNLQMGNYSVAPSTVGMNSATGFNAIQGIQQNKTSETQNQNHQGPGVQGGQNLVDQSQQQGQQQGHHLQQGQGGLQGIPQGGPQISQDISHQAHQNQGGQINSSQSGQLGQNIGNSQTGSSGNENSQEKFVDENDDDALIKFD